MITIEEGKKFIAERIFEGSKCPCCSQIVKGKKVNFSKDMAEILFWIYFIAKDIDLERFIDVCESLKKITDISIDNCNKLLLWGFLERRIGVKKVFWKITNDGILFLKGISKVSRQSFEFNGIGSPLAGKELYIDDLIEGFSLEEMIKNNLSKKLQLR